MTDDEALALMQSLSTEPASVWPTATRVVQHRNGGGADAWDLATDTDTYITKFANNPQEPQPPDPRKVVTSDLIVGRIGQLFAPATTPPVTVLMVPLELIEGEPIHMGGGLATSGPAFGSLLIPHHTETKAGAQLTSVPSERIAQILGFQALAWGTDLAALVSEDGSSAVSIDHGGYFGGGGWGSHLGADAESPRIELFAGMDASTLRDPAIWATVVAQLAAISDRDLARAFTGVPPEWGCDLGLLAPLLAVTSRRRDRLPEVIDAYCQS